MAITIDGATKRIVLDSTDVSAAQIWTAWVDWHALNPQWPLAFSLVGGIALGGGLFIPPYFFLLNGWRVRPMEANQTLIITGNLVVDGGGVPVVQTLGAFNVSVQYTVPVQAQGISTGGGSSGLTPTQAQQLLDLWRKESLDPTKLVTHTPTSIKVGDPLAPDIEITLTGNRKTLTTMERQ